MSGRAKKAHPGLGACQSEKLELELARSLCASGSITDMVRLLSTRVEKKAITVAGWATMPQPARRPGPPACWLNKIPSGVSREASVRLLERSKVGIKAVFNVTAMERSILAELFERGGRGQLSGLRDRRPKERLVNKGFVERHTLNSQQEEYVLTAIGKKVVDNK